MILVDTSAWVEYDRATDSPIDRHLTKLISGRADIVSTEPVMMELLAGARDEPAAARLRRLLTSFGWVTADPHTDFEGAARVYRTCRARGVTPRGLVDCMIVAISLRSGARLLATDADFARMATILPLQLESV